MSSQSFLLVWFVGPFGQAATTGNHRAATQDAARAFLVDLLDEVSEQDTTRDRSDPAGWHVTALLTACPHDDRPVPVHCWDGTVTEIRDLLAAASTPTGTMPS